MRSIRSRYKPQSASPQVSRAFILGIDPGLLRTGYAILSADGMPTTVLEAGLIRLDPRASLSDRLADLAESIAGLIRKHRPSALACEALYAHYRHPRTAILMGHARGVILAEAARAGLEVLSISATQVKKMLTGFGHAGKGQIQRAVAATLGLPRVLEPHDVADAAAIAFCGLQLSRAGQNHLSNRAAEGAPR